MLRFVSVLNRTIDHLVVALFSILFGVVLLQVCFRYILDSPFVWSEELSRYLFIWISLLGWTLAARNKTHISVALFLNLCSPRLKRWLAVFNDIATAVFALVLIHFGTEMVIRSLDVPTITLFFNFAVIYAAVPVCAAIICLIAGVDIWQRFHDAGAGSTEGGAA